MALPVYVGKTTATATSVSSKSVSYSSTAGNCLLVAVVLNDGTQSVTAITDSAGNDSFGNPLNQWINLGTSNLNGCAVSLWGCKGAAAITSVTVSLSGNQDISVGVIEYEQVTSFATAGTIQVNGSQNDPISPATPQDTHITIEVEQTPTEQGQLIVGFFGLLLSGLPGDSQLISGASQGTLRENLGSSSPTPNLAIVENGTTDSAGNLDVGVTLDDYIEGGSPNYYNYLNSSSLQCCWVILSGGFALSHQPGFSDISDSAFAAGEPALGINLVKISENAAFGMVRVEVFYGEYSDGETVDTPQSPVDGYPYEQSELLYCWVVRSTVAQNSGWASAEQALWYANWYVEQFGDANPGTVHCEEWYTWIHGSKPATRTSDGILGVFVIAQRQLKNLTMEEEPYYSGLPDSDFAQDKAYAQDILQTLNENAKFAVVNTEVIYMGEFVTGEQIPQPTSPVDGYVYPYNQVGFLTAIRWTTQGGTYTQPSSDSTFLQNMQASVDSSGNVSITVTTWNTDGTAAQSGWGRVAIFAFCQRNAAYVLVDVPSGTQPWSLSGINSSFNFNPKNAGSAPVAVPMKFAAGEVAKLTFVPQSSSHYLTTHYDGSTGASVSDYIGLSGYMGGSGATGSSSDPYTYGGVGSGSNYFPTKFMSGSPARAFSVVGCWVDDDGNVIETVDIESLSGGKTTCPSGATTLQLGFNCSDYTEMTGGDCLFQVTKTATSFPLGAQFKEIDPLSFMPGSTLPFGTMQQINENIREAICVPEIFGPTAYSNGNTVSLPVSPIDGYEYEQSECFYIWYWKNFGASSSTRVIVAEGWVDPSNGEVHIKVCELPHGGEGTFYNDGQLEVITVAVRSGTGRLPSSNSTSINSSGGLNTSDTIDLTVNGLDPWSNLV